MAEIAIEVVYALPDRQHLLRLNVPAGTTLRGAVLRPEMRHFFPGVDLASAPLGIFGKRVFRAEELVLEEGERVEIYRPLLVDLKEVRKVRAVKARVAQQGD